MTGVRAMKVVRSSPDVPAVGTDAGLRPVGLLLLGTLSHIVDDDEASLMVERLVAALAPGSHMVIVHPTALGRTDLALYRLVAASGSRTEGPQHCRLEPGLPGSPPTQTPHDAGRPTRALRQAARPAPGLQPPGTEHAVTTAPSDQPSGLSEQARQNLDAALQQITDQRGFPAGKKVEWPTEQLAASLAWDGEFLVIDHLTATTALTVLMASIVSKQEPEAIVQYCTLHYAGLAAPGAPPYATYSLVAWVRAADSALNRLAAPLRGPVGGPVEAVDLAGALAAFSVLIHGDIPVWKTDPDPMSSHLAGGWDADTS